MPSEQEVEAGAEVIQRAFGRGGQIANVGDLVREILEAADRVRAPKAFAAEGTEGMRALHRARALQAIAEHRCSTDLTTGFCSPRDCKCQWEKGGKQVGCCASAEGILQAVESRGMTVVWERDPTLTITMEKRL